MDETPVWFEMPGKSTLAERGEKEVRVATTGHEKERLTVTLAAYADGTKLPPLVHLPGVQLMLTFLAFRTTLGSHPYCLFHWFHIHEIYASG
jgi:hypothetical protein